MDCLADMRACLCTTVELSSFSHAAAGIGAKLSTVSRAIAACAVRPVDAADAPD